MDEPKKHDEKELLAGQEIGDVDLVGNYCMDSGSWVSGGCTCSACKGSLLNPPYTTDPHKPVDSLLVGTYDPNKAVHDLLVLDLNALEAEGMADISFKHYLAIAIILAVCLGTLLYVGFTIVWYLSGV